MTTTNAINQKEYLKRYLSGGSKDGKKKKRKKPKPPGTTGRGLSIVDDNLVSTTVDVEDETDLYELAENAPQVAGVFDDRPIHIQAQESFGAKWKALAVDDSRKESSKNDSRQDADAHSSSRNRKGSDSDVSPPRATRARDSDSDVSIPRKSSKSGNVRHRQASDSDDYSPPRKGTTSSASKAADYRNSSSSRQTRDEVKRKDGKSTSPARRQTGSDSDPSPPRKSRRSRSPKRLDKDSRKHSNEDVSPPRHKSKSHKSYSPARNRDYSPKRTSRDRRTPERRDQRTERSPKRRRRGSDSDVSPPRSNNDRPSSSKSSNRDSRRPTSNISPTRKSKDSGGRQRRSRSPVQRKEVNRDKARQNNSDSDLSPPRSKSTDRRKESLPLSRGRKRGGDSDSDLSPPRVKKEPITPPRSSTSSSIPPVRIKQEPVDPEDRPKTLEGKRAGLQDARTLKSELEALRKKEQEHFQQMEDHISGRGAQAVFRDRKTGRRRDLEQEERQTEEEKAAERKKKDEFSKLSRGVVQEEQRAQRVQEALHEMSKPVARYAGDQDLERHLKEQERDGDPMLDYLRAKRRKENPVDDKPAYKGPSGPPNRFGILPGHRWDGVDRSNGYENKLFASRNARQANLEEAHMWSVADM